jgi:hypothetical protein
MNNSRRSTARAFRPDTRVRWRADHKPTGQPDREGTVFSSTQRMTVVRWDDGELGFGLATVALEVVR